MSRVTIKPAVTDRRYNGENTELGLLMRMTSSRIFRISVLLLLSCYPLTIAGAQDLHSHTPGVSGVPQGIPYFCANPTVTSSGNGMWSDSKTWSTGRVPRANDKVK